jgi:hypothetical protein
MSSVEEEGFQCRSAVPMEGPVESWMSACEAEMHSSLQVRTALYCGVTCRDILYCALLQILLSFTLCQSISLSISLSLSLPLSLSHTHTHTLSLSLSPSPPSLTLSPHPLTPTSLQHNRKLPKKACSFTHLTLAVNGWRLYWVW